VRALQLSTTSLTLFSLSAAIIIPETQWANFRVLYNKQYKAATDLSFVDVTTLPAYDKTAPNVRLDACYVQPGAVKSQIHSWLAVLAKREKSDRIITVRVIYAKNQDIYIRAHIDGYFFDRVLTYTSLNERFVAKSVARPLLRMMKQVSGILVTCRFQAAPGQSSERCLLTIRVRSAIIHCFQTLTIVQCIAQPDRIVYHFSNQERPKLCQSLAKVEAKSKTKAKLSGILAQCPVEVIALIAKHVSLRIGARLALTAKGSSELIRQLCDDDKHNIWSPKMQLCLQIADPLDLDPRWTGGGNRWCWDRGTMLYDLEDSMASEFSDYNCSYASENEQREIPYDWGTFTSSDFYPSNYVFFFF